MRYISISIILAVSLAACANHGPEVPVEARQVNAAIEERIASQVVKGQADGYPDLSAIPSKAPTLENPKTRRTQREAILAKAQSLSIAIDRDDVSGANSAVKELAAELEEAIARDRAAVKREGNLSDNLPNPSPDPNPAARPDQSPELR